MRVNIFGQLLILCAILTLGIASLCHINFRHLKVGFLQISYVLLIVYALKLHSENLLSVWVSR